MFFGGRRGNHLDVGEIATPAKKQRARNDKGKILCLPGLKKHSGSLLF